LFTPHRKGALKEFFLKSVGLILLKACKTLNDNGHISAQQELSRIKICPHFLRREQNIDVHFYDMFTFYEQDANMNNS